MPKQPFHLPSASTWLRAFAMALTGASASTFAHADCGPVISAYGKADATRRFALFEVDTLAQAPKGEPFMVVVGDVRYTQNIVRKSALQFVIDGYKAGGYAAGLEAGSLKGREQKGEVRCEPLGERKVGAEAAIGYQIRNNDKGTQPDPTAIHMWVNRTTGLPMYHGMGSDGGLRWVYGTEVTAPGADKLRK
jgi:hypothetical protein